MNDQTIVRWEGKFLRVLQQGRWEYADRRGTTGAVAIVAVTDGGNLVLTEQFRIPVGRRVIELPAGLAGDLPGSSNEDFSAAAHRELLEETGYDAGHMVRLASGPPSAGLASEVVGFYHATRLRKTGPGGGDEHEQIQVHEVPLAGFREWIAARLREGVSVDPKVYAGLYLIGAH